jgi:osmotically-inducible protein OsmY
MSHSRNRFVATILSVIACVAVVAAACTPSVAVGTDDASITARVRTVLMNDAQIDALRMDVSTAGGVVTLSGVVNSSGAADRALSLARQVEGVREVKSTLRVAATGG